MRRIASLLAILVLLTAAAPLLACMTGRAMIQRESVCCRSMHGNCVDMAKMDCCRTEVRADVHPQQASTAPLLHADFAVVAWLPVVTHGPRNLPAFQMHFSGEHSPPGFATANVTVLRI